MSGERGSRPGVTWESVLRPGGEAVVEVKGDDGSPFGRSETAGPDFNELMPPRPNRAARRAAQRLARTERHRDSPDRS